MPLVRATGAGAATQRAVGMSVFGGMIAASLVGILLIPGLYVIFQMGREKAHALVGKPIAPVEPAQPPDH